MAYEARIDVSKASDAYIRNRMRLCRINGEIPSSELMAEAIRRFPTFNPDTLRWDKSDVDLDNASFKSVRVTVYNRLRRNKPVEKRLLDALDKYGYQLKGNSVCKKDKVVEVQEQKKKTVTTKKHKKFKLSASKVCSAPDSGIMHKDTFSLLGRILRMRPDDNAEFIWCASVCKHNDFYDVAINGEPLVKNLKSVELTTFGDNTLLGIHCEMGQDTVLPHNVSLYPTKDKIWLVFNTNIDYQSISQERDVYAVNIKDTKIVDGKKELMYVRTDFDNRTIGWRDFNALYQIAKNTRFCIK